jgi:FMN phosphatase YigB (HAD superfamily)
MHALIWVPPWVAQGDALFHENAFRRHLMLQARALSQKGWSVSVVAGELLTDRLGELPPGVALLRISMEQARELTGSLADPSEGLYARPEAELGARVLAGLGAQLPSDVDLVLLWETPVPFLEQRYPRALFLHQMPGAVSRPPFPHTVTVDPRGLYNRGTLRHAARAILETPLDGPSQALVDRFIEAATCAIASTNPFTRAALDPQGRFRQLLLLPLQVSDHYAFRADTPYRAQSEFVLDVLARVPSDVGVVVTQYVTPRVQDRVMTADLVSSLASRWPNLIYNPRFDEIPAISQYLLPLVDAVCTCSSSLGLQAAIWRKQLLVPHDTFLKPFEDRSDFGAIGERPSSDKCDRTLAFLLCRSQPLAHSVTEDADFLESMVEDMQSRRAAGREGVEAMPNFLALDPDYERKLISAFRPEQAARDTGKLGPMERGRSETLAAFRALVTQPEIETISFDVFDTLIKRGVALPLDVWKLMESRAARLAGDKLEDFGELRRIAEVTTRASSTAGEITFDEIYQYVQETRQLTDAETERLKQLEIETEIELCSGRELGCAMLAIARQAGKRVVLTTDMYLPRSVIERLLARAGLRESTGHADRGASTYDHMFLSSELGVRKREGELFDLILREERLEPKALLHVGDHEISDVASPQKRGIKAFHLLRAVERMQQNQRHVRKFKLFPPSRNHSVARSVVAALVSHRLFDAASGKLATDTQFFGDPFTFGYAGLGPAMAGYALWLGKQARRDGIDQLFFLAREGRLIKQVYDSLYGSVAQGAAGASYPASHYLLGSRRALRVANIRSRQDVLNLALHPISDREASVAQLLSRRFGLLDGDVPVSLFKQAGFSGPEELAALDPEGLPKLRNLSLLLEDKILARATQEREAYLVYAESMGLVKARAPAVVDLGWAANMQGALSELLGRPIPGYYYASLESARRWKERGLAISGYAGDFVAWETHPSALVQKRPLAEYLICDSSNTLTAFDLQQGVAVARFRADAQPQGRQSLIDAVHRGVVAFARDLKDGVGSYLEELELDPFMGEALYRDFVEEPAAEDARILLGQYQEDDFGGLPKRYIIAVDRRGGFQVEDSYWRAGATALARAERAEQKGLLGALTRTSNKVAGGVVLPVEERVLGMALNARKLGKYRRDRGRFFEESQSPLLKWWGTLSRDLARKG